MIIPSSLLVFYGQVHKQLQSKCFALCSEIADPNVVCNEQYNSRSNIYTTTTWSNNTTTSSNSIEEESELSLCFNITCNLTEEYIPENEIDPEDTLSEAFDYQLINSVRINLFSKASFVTDVI